MKGSVFARSRIFGLLTTASFVGILTHPGSALAQASAAQAPDSASVPPGSGASEGPSNQTTSETLPTPASKTGGGAAGDIVVTARRTEEKLQNVPVAVSAFSGAALQERHIQTEADLQSVTPGLTVRQTTSSNDVNYSLRGQSLDAISFSSPAVVAYYNEFGAQGYSAATFFDLASVQVLKGPQGTLFGRNATGGAVLYQTVLPTLGKVTGYARADYGNYNDRLLEGAVNIPISDWAAFRMAGQWEKRKGFQHNLFLGTRNGSVDNLTLRPSLLIEPSSSFKNVTVFQYGRYGGVSTGLKAGSIYLPGETNNGIPLNPAIPSGAAYANGSTNPQVQALGFTSLADYFNKQKNIGFYDIYNNQDGRHRAHQYLVTNTTTLNLSNTTTLKNIAGFNRVTSNDHTDVDGTPFEPLVIGFSSGTAADGYTYLNRQVSDELQISGKFLNDRLSYIVGLYYFDGKAQFTDADRILGDIVGGPTAVFLRTFELDNFSKAVYGQTTYKITDALNFTAGGRYTWELLKYKGLPGDINLLSGVPSASSTESKPSWNFTLDWKVAQSLLLYAAQRGSWRTGGYNGTATDTVNGQTVVNGFKPETTYDFEVGAKFAGRVGGAPARFNIALYDQYVHDVIRVIYAGFSANSGNANKARVRGVEADGSINPTSWLELGGAFTYTDAKYTDPRALVAGTSFIFGPYGDTPKMSGSVYGRVSHDLPGNDGQLVARGDFYAQKHFYYSNANDTVIPGTKIAGYHLVNARLEWNKIGGTKISAAAFAKNLTNEKYNVGGFALGAVFGINGALPGLPRMYGGEIRIDF